LVCVLAICRPADMSHTHTHTHTYMRTRTALHAHVTARAHAHARYLGGGVSVEDGVGPAEGGASKGVVDRRGGRRARQIDLRRHAPVTRICKNRKFIKRIK